MKLLLVSIMALMLAACGSNGEDDAAQAYSATGSRPAATGDDSVAAVLDSQGTPVAQLRFLIGTRPMVGAPFRMQLMVSTSAPIPQLLATFESASLSIDGTSSVLQLVLDDTGSGSTLAYKGARDLMLTARNAGLAEVSVRLSTGPDAPETVYVIPVLVADAAAGVETPASGSDKADPPAEADNTQP